MTSLYRRFIQVVEQYYIPYVVLYSLKTYATRLFFGHEDVYLFFPNTKVCLRKTAKVASSSLTLAFARKEESDFSYNRNQDIHVNTEKYSITSQEASKKKAYTLAFVRNPFERLVSFYENKLFPPAGNHIIYNSLWLFRHHMSFEECVRNTSLLPDRVTDVHLVSQSYRINPKNTDFIGRFETLQDDYKKLAKKFGLGPLPHTNKSKKKKKWQDYYTHKTAKKIYKRYKKDFETWYPNAYKELLGYLDSK